MSITVREALELEPLAQGRLVAGRRGIDRVIRWVTIVEVLEDAGLLQPGELLVTTAYDLENQPERRRTYIADLATRDLAGVAILTGFYIKEIPPEMIEQANEHGLPLIQLPPSINFSDITRALLERIVNRQYELMHSSESVHRELTELALGDRDLADITSVVARWTGGRVIFCNRRWDRVAAGGEADELHEVVMAAVQAEIGEDASDHPRELIVAEDQTGSAYAALVVPVRASDRFFGNLVLIKLKGQLKDLDRVALGHASTVGALVLMRGEAVAEENRRLRGDLLDRILAGASAHNQTAVIDQARRFGCDLTKPHVAVVFRIRVVESQGRGGALAAADTSREAFESRRRSAGRLLRVVEEVVAGDGRSILVREREGDVLALIDATGLDEPVALARDVLTRWAAIDPGGPVVVAGVGEKESEVARFALSARQAQDAARLGPLLPGAPTLVEHRDLGVFRLVADMERRHVDLDAAVRAGLGPLADDTPRARRLLETLEAYLENDGNLQATAAALFVHRHTLRYRLERISDMMGRSLRDPLDRLELHLAVALHHYRRLRRAQAGEVDAAAPRVPPR